MDDTISIRRGETFYEPVKYFDTTATSVTITVTDDDGTDILTTTANFSVVDGWAVAELKSDDTDIPIGTYNWMLTIVTPDSTIKLPDPDDCDGGCDLPDFVVCEANDMGGDS